MTNINDREKLESQLTEQENVKENILKELEEKISQTVSDREVEKFEKEIKTLESKLESFETYKKELQDRLDFYAQASGSDAPQEIYRVFVPGGSELRLNYYHLNNIGKQMNVYFARLDNPFLDTYNATQKEELVRSILGTPVGTDVPTTPDTVITDNNAADPN